MKKTPIALFTYNRPNHADLALAALSRCPRLVECDLYIYCDGPKTPEQMTAVAASRHVVHQWADRLGATVIERSQNLGLASSIVTGVTELCEQYGRVIVVEDDLIVSPDFSDYMLQALDKYQDESKVYQISGYMFPVEHPIKPDAFFLPLTTTWGWATWQRAWCIFDGQAADAEEKLADPQIHRRFNLDNTHAFSNMLKKQLAGQLNSWGVLWWWSVFKVDGLVLHPQKSLVWVGGWDGSGTHCGTSDSGFSLSPLDAFKQPRLSFPLVLPDQAMVDQEAFNRVKMFLRKRRKKEPFFLGSRLSYRIKWGWDKMKKLLSYL